MILCRASKIGFLCVKELFTNFWVAIIKGEPTCRTCTMMRWDLQKTVIVAVKIIVIVTWSAAMLRHFKFGGTVTKDLACHHH